MDFMEQVAAETERLLVDKGVIENRLAALASYRLAVEGDTGADVPDNVSPIRPAKIASLPEPTFKRGERTAAIVKAIQRSDGVDRKGIILALALKGDKRAEQAVSNTLAKLKKDGVVSHEEGVYRWAGESA